MICQIRQRAGRSSPLCLPSQTIRVHRCMLGVKHLRSTVTGTAAAGGALRLAQTHARTGKQRSASIASGMHAPGATCSGFPMGYLPSRSEWRTGTACDSRRAAARRAQNGHSEASSNHRQHQDTIHAGGIDSLPFADHALLSLRIASAGTLLPLLHRRAATNNCRLRHLCTMSTPPLLLSYASSSEWPFPDTPPTSTKPNPLRIAILDSSFNPPSLAHYAIATYKPHAFDAHLLLLSSKNVDKVPGPGDSSFEDRTAMMKIMAKHMQDEASGEITNIAVGSLAAATFAEKAPIIQDYLQASPVHRAGQQYTLVFFIGFDTVTRLFMPKYYDNSEDNMHNVLEKFFVNDNCQVICAKRPVENVAQKDVADQQEESFFARPEVSKYVDMGKLQLVDVDGTAGISSTKIRNALKQLASSNAGDAEEKLRTLVLGDILTYCKNKGLYNQ